MADGPPSSSRRPSGIVEFQRKGSLVEFLDRSPLKDSGLTIERPQDLPRDIEL